MTAGMGASIQGLRSASFGRVMHDHEAFSSAAMADS